MTATTATEADRALDTALDKLIDEAGRFDRRDPRACLVNVRFTEAELELLDALAERAGTNRIDTIRDLLAAGVDDRVKLRALARAAANLVRRIRRQGLVTQVGTKDLGLIDDALAGVD